MNGAPPPIVPGLAVGDVVGAGGFATTWAARRDGVEVVIKVGHQRDLIIRARFDREAAVLTRVGAPAAPALHAAGELADGRPYLVLERVAGAPLRELSAAGPLPVRRALALAGALVGRVAAVHAAGVVHADLQPTNLLVDGDDLRLIDFGSARWLGPAGAGGAAAVDVTSHGVAVLTPGYAAPEQRRGAPLDARADLYAIGVVLHELLGGARPFAGEPRAEERGHLLLRPPAVEREVAPAVRALIAELLRKQPARRPPSAAAVAARLAAAIADAPTPTVSTHPRAPAPLPPAPPPPERRAPGPAIVAGVIGAAPSSEVDAIARAAGAWVARRRGERTVLVWPGARAAMFERARRAARHLAGAYPVRVVLHVATVRLRAGAGGDGSAYGAELDDPQWLAGGDGVAETPGFAASAPDRIEPPLVGRERELAVLVGAGRAALLGAPALCTLEGEPGTGRSRLLRGAANALAPVRVLALDAAVGGRLPAGAAALLEARSPLIVTVDDADRIEPAVLDALEDAVIGAGTRALAVLAAATAALRRTRPLWGRRLERHQVVALDELADDAAIELAIGLLAPVEHAPRDAVRSLVDACGRRPRDLVDGVRWFVAHGGIRRAGGGGWQLATDRIDAGVLADDDARRLAGLDGLAPEVRELAHAVAVIGDAVTIDELEAIQARLDEDGHHLAVDAETGLGLLADDGVLVARAGAWSYRDPAVAEAAARATPPDRRSALHRTALACARARGDRARIARHGAAAGEPGEAVAAGVELGVAALARCRAADAERHLTVAIEVAGAPPALARAARTWRGRARYLQGRVEDALADLTGAAAAAEAAGDHAQAARACLELATAHDLGADMAAAAAAAAAARRLAGPAPADDLQRGLALAEARGRWRAGEVAAAAAALAEVAAVARQAGDDFVEVVALVLRGPALALLGDLAGAARAFDEALASCSRRGDAFHAAAAYANRLLLRRAHNDPTGAQADLEAALRCTRQTGWPTGEAVILHNLAELHLRAGRHDDAVLAMAARSLLLDQRFLAVPPAASHLLVACLHAERGEDAAAARHLAAVRALPAADLVPFEQLLLDVLDDRAPVDAVAQARTLTAPSELEVLYWLLRRGAEIDRGAAAERASRLLGEHALYRARLAALGISPDTRSS